MKTTEELYKNKYVYYLRQGGYSFVWADNIEDALKFAKKGWSLKGLDVNEFSLVLCTEEIEEKLDSKYYVNENWSNEIHLDIKQLKKEVGITNKDIANFFGLTVSVYSNSTAKKRYENALVEFYKIVKK